MQLAANVQRPTFNVQRSIQKIQTVGLRQPFAFNVKVERLPKRNARTIADPGAADFYPAGAV
jgi:hypothetical protein